MNPKIFVLAGASFAMGTEAYVYAGHLDALAADLGRSVAVAGQLATAFAVTYAASAPIVAGLATGFGRRGVIVSGLVLIGLFNVFAALSPSYPVLFASRIACGLAAGLAGPIASLAAAELAPAEQRGKAMAVVLAGMTLAFVLGIPAGSVIGDFAGWRGTFAYAGALALVAAVAIRVVLPAIPGGRRAGLGAFAAVPRPAIAGPLALTLLGFAATFTAVAYVGPIVTAISDLRGSGIGAMQALIGVGSIAGVIAGARMADRAGGSSILIASFAISAVALGSYSLLMATRGFDAGDPLLSSGRFPFVAALGLAMAAGSAALFARTPVIQARLVAAAPPEARGVIVALNGSMVFAGQGLGAAIGGATIGLWGLPGLGLSAAAVALLGALVAAGGVAFNPARRPAVLPAE